MTPDEGELEHVLKVLHLQPADERKALTAAQRAHFQAFHYSMEGKGYSGKGRRHVLTITTYQISLKQGKE